MEKKEDEIKFNRILVRENEAINVIEQSLAVKEINNTRLEKLEFIKNIAKSNDVGRILALEKSALIYDLANYANTDATTTSITEGITDIERIENTLDKVSSPNDYKIIDEQYTKKGDRIKGLPKDIAYRAFKSHQARLQNPDRMIGISNEEKEIFNARFNAITTALNLYQEKQAKVLGIEFPIRKKKSL